jgi:nicotinamide-nucleotide amidase
MGVWVAPEALGEAGALGVMPAGTVPVTMKRGSEAPGASQRQPRGSAGMGEHDDGLDAARAAAVRLGERLREAGRTFATAESCTGGGVAWVCTDVPGSSAWFRAGLVTYALVAKERLLGVPAELLERHGAVSEPVARAMAEGARRVTGVDLAVSVTGIAGPAGGEVLQPVGTVWFAWALADARTRVAVERFEGDRAAVRAAAVARALEGALACVGPGADA